MMEEIGADEDLLGGSVDDHQQQGNSQPRPLDQNEPESDANSEHGQVEDEENSESITQLDNNLESPSIEVQLVAADDGNADSAEARKQSSQTNDATEPEEAKGDSQDPLANDAANLVKAKAKSKVKSGKSQKKPRRRAKSARQLVVRIPAAMSAPCGADDKSKEGSRETKTAADKDRHHVSFDKDSQQQRQQRQQQSPRRRTLSAPECQPPVSNEMKMLQKLAELQALMSRDYRTEARLCYRRGLVESGCLWRSFAAAAATGREPGGELERAAAAAAESSGSGRRRRLIVRPEAGGNRLLAAAGGQHRSRDSFLPAVAIP